MKYLILGAGYVGKYLAKKLPDAILIEEKLWHNSEFANLVRLRYPSHYLINCAGRTGKPNVDACEDDKAGTAMANLMLPFMIAEGLKEAKSIWMHIGSGCVYNGYEREWTEDDEPNFDGSFYSKTKLWSQKILAEYAEVCVLRIRMPIDEDISDRSYVAKVVKYAKEGRKLFSLPNSMTMLDDLVGAIRYLSERGITGTYNVVNKGSLGIQELLELYRGLVEKDLEYNIVPLEEVEATLKARRSNCVLSGKKLDELGYKMPEIKERLVEVLKRKPRANDF